MALESACVPPEALRDHDVQQGHEEPLPLEFGNHEQEKRLETTNLVLLHLALSFVFFHILSKLTACELWHSTRQDHLLPNDKLIRANANYETESGVDESSKKVDRQSIGAFYHPNESDLERGNQRRTGGEQRWPFLLRFPITVYGITLGLGSHAVMWKNIASLSPMKAEHVPRIIGAIFWMFSILHLLITTVIYSIKFVRWSRAVRMEFQHPVRSNFFAAPFIAALFLIVGAPKFATRYVTESTKDTQLDSNVPAAFVFTALLLLYEIHIYGRWLLSRAHKLSEIANPTTQIAVIGNFVSATAFALAGWREISLFMFTVGTMHQLVVLKIIFSRFTSDRIIDIQLRPTYFLIIAPPSVASVAWSGIHGTVDDVASVLTFTAVFFLVIMISRAGFFFATGVRFSLSWWAFTFPSAAVSMSVLNYESGRSLSRGQYFVQMNNFNIPKIFSFSLVLFSCLLLMGVSFCTVVHASSGQLFVNDQVVKSAFDDLNESGRQTRQQTSHSSYCCF